LSACTSPTADVVFVVDSSGSIGSSDFREVKSFIGSVVDAFDISGDKVRVALVQFSSNAVVEFNLQRYSNKRSVKAAVAALPYYNGGKQTMCIVKTGKARYPYSYISSVRVAELIPDSRQSACR